MHKKISLPEPQSSRSSEWRIPLTETCFGEDEVRSVADVIRSGWWTNGPLTQALEGDWKDYLKVKHAMAVSSGTAALHTAMVYLNPDPGDEILVSPITDMGSAIPILYQQAVPVFVDIDPFNQNMDPKLIEERLSPRTRESLRQG